MILAAIRRVIVICFGFFLAIVSAAFLFTAAIVGDRAFAPSADVPLADHIFLFGVATGVVAAFAGTVAGVPVFVAATIAETFRVTGLAIHLIYGCLVGAVTAAVWQDSVAGPLAEAPFLEATAAGAVGAFVYWLVAGRFAGRWRSDGTDNRETEVTPPGSPEA